MTPARLESACAPPPARADFELSAAFSTSAHAVPSGYFSSFVARDDQGAAQGDHHQDAEQRAEHGHQGDASDLQVEAENEDRGHGDAEAERDRLARRARGLHDVVLEDGGIAQGRLTVSARSRAGLPCAVSPRVEGGVSDSTILENNIVQTAGSAGESIAFGLGVTMPAILILGFDLEIARVTLVAVLGALLGILMMIPCAAP